MCFYSRASRQLGVPCTPRRRRAVQGATWARAATCSGADAGRGTAARPLVGRRGSDPRCVQTGIVGRWHGGSWSGAWTDGR
jgi:hypothetical protein